MSARETAAVAAILTDPENQNRTAEELASIVIEALDETRAQFHRVAVVGQIRFPEAPGTVHTAVLGPFSSRSRLDSPERFERALRGRLAARTIGQELAVDPKTKTAQARFIIAPAFLRPRDAWEFYRAEEWRDRIPRERLENIQATIQRWEPGLWAREVNPPPACHCASQRPGRVNRLFTGEVTTPGPCPRHGDYERREP